MEITYFVPDDHKSSGEFVTITGNVRCVDDYHREIVTIQNNKNFVYLHKRNFEITNNRLANEKIKNLTNAMLSRGTKKRLLKIVLGKMYNREKLVI